MNQLTMPLATTPALPLPEVVEFHTEFTPRGDGRVRFTARFPGYYTARTFRDRRCAEAYRAALVRRFFPTLV